MELLTVKETAELLKLSPLTVRRYIAAGRLSAVRIGGRVRVEREAVNGLMEPIASGSKNGNQMLEDWEPTSTDDPLWNIVGIIDDDDGPTDVSENIHRYIADAIEDSHR